MYLQLQLHVIHYFIFSIIFIFNMCSPCQKIEIKSLNFMNTY